MTTGAGAGAATGAGAGTGTGAGGGAATETAGGCGVAMVSALASTTLRRRPGPRSRSSAMRSRRLRAVACAFGLALDDFVEHAQRLFVVALRGVDLRERDGRDRRRTLKIVVALAVAADRCGRIGQIQTGFDHAGEQVARDAEPAARATLVLQIGLATPHDLVAQLHAGHLLGPLDAASTGAQGSNPHATACPTRRGRSPWRRD